MGLIRFCVRRPVFTWVTVLLACFLGVYSYFKLGVALYPKVDIPVVVVYAAYRGASPGEIEQLVAKPLEDAVSKVEGVKKIESYSLEGFCYVVAELFYEVDLNQATLDVSNKVKETREKLPKDADEPTVEKVDINADSFMKVVFTSPLPPKQARDILDDQVVRQLTRVTGVAEVDLAGGQEREIHLLLDPRALKSYGVSIQRVAALIAANNVTNPSGYIAQGDREITLRFKGEAPAVQALGEIRVPLQNGASVRLSALGRIEDGIKDVRRLTRYDGADAFLIYVKARPNANVVNVGRDVRKALDRILPTLPGGFKMDVAFDDSEFIRDAVKNVLRDMVVGTLLTGLVLYLFLRRLSATLVVALAMPAAVLATFVPMVGQGFTLNVMSTLGLAITMGVLVNNSILVLENVYRYRDLGYEPLDAAEKGTGEIAISVLATTATNLGVFLPVAFVPGVAGQFLEQYAMTIVYATVFSLWVSLTVTPMVAARIMGAKEPSRISRFLCGWWTWLYQGFEDLHHALITRAVLHPWKTVLFFLALTGGCFALASRIGTEFLPRADDGTVTLQMELPAESSLARTDRLVRVAEEHVRQLPHVRHVTAVTGSTGSRSGTHMGKVELTLDKDKTARPSSFRIASDLRPFAASLPDATVSVQAARADFHSGKPLKVVVAGEDTGTLLRVAEQVKEIMRDVPGVVDVDLDWKLGRPELRLDPLRWRLGQLDLDVASLSEAVRGYITGLKAGTYREGGLEYDILAKLDPGKTESIFQTPELPILTPSGMVPLKELATFSTEAGPTRVVRKDRLRTVTVEGDVVGRSVGEAFGDIQKGIADIPLPQGYRFLFEGEAEDMRETFTDMGIAFALAVAITFLMIAAILESWAFSVIIMLTVPLSAIGVIPALVMTDTTMSLYGLMGMVMLVGLVVNNAIVVIDYAEVLRKGGMTPSKAIVEACGVRLRSIVMADATSIIAMIPLAIGSGDGGEMRAPMAIVAIGGLVAGGTLALFAIPPVYKLYWAVRIRLARRRQRGLRGLRTREDVLKDRFV